MKLISLPNFVTILRVVLIPVLIYSFWQANTLSSWQWWLFAIFILGICEISDVLDGILARSLEQVTDIGKILDPLCDSLLRFSVFLSLSQIGLIPGWTIFVFFYRDLCVAYLRIQAMGKNIVFSAQFSGKLKAVVQALGVFIIITLEMLYDYDKVFMQKILGLADPKMIHLGVMYIVCGITIWSGMDYAQKIYKILSKD